MRLSISNIAWPAELDDQVATLLQTKGVDAIDIAPGKYFSDPAKADSIAAGEVVSYWACYGIEIVGMQSLLFGTTGLNLFGAAEVRSDMHQHLAGICRLGGMLGAHRLTFGSPKNRDRSGLTDDETLQIALEFFRNLGDAALSTGTVICLEPNPSNYGCNFMTTAAETLEIVSAIDHPGIKMQFDAGALTTNAESYAEFLCLHASKIGHIHISEPELLPLGQTSSSYGSTDHDILAAAIQKNIPDAIITIEMLTPQGQDPLAIVAAAVDFAHSKYSTYNAN